MHQTPMIDSANARQQLQLSPKVGSSASGSTLNSSCDILWTVAVIDLSTDRLPRYWYLQEIRDQQAAAERHSAIFCQEPHSPTSASLGPWRGPENHSTNPLNIPVHILPILLHNNYSPSLSIPSTSLLYPLVPSSLPIAIDRPYTAAMSYPPHQGGYPPHYGAPPPRELCSSH